NIEHSRTTDTEGAVLDDFAPLPELAELREAMYFGDGEKHLSWEYLKQLTPLSLAVWYMDNDCSTNSSRNAQEGDDGGSCRLDICVEAMSPGSRRRLIANLRDTHELDVELTTRESGQGNVARFTATAAARFQELVAPYIPECMAHKLLPRFQNRCEIEPVFSEPVERLVASEVLDVQVDSEPQNTRKFDIEVEGNHNYFVDGVMVHNSPETTTGGRALKFYSSVRLDVRRIETLKDGTDAVGNRTRVRVVKNKVSPPFKQAEFDILYGVGISREGSLIDLGVEHGIVRKSGAWRPVEGNQLGQGKENARQFLKDNPDLADEIERKVKAKLGIGPRPEGEDLDAELQAVAAGQTNGVPEGVDPRTGEVSVNF